MATEFYGNFSYFQTPFLKTSRAILNFQVIVVAGCRDELLERKHPEVGVRQRKSCVIMKEKEGGNE
jgi:hypothetical protein